MSAKDVNLVHVLFTNALSPLFTEQGHIKKVIKAIQDIKQNIYRYMEITNEMQKGFLFFFKFIYCTNSLDILEDIYILTLSRLFSNLPAMLDSIHVLETFRRSLTHSHTMTPFDPLVEQDLLKTLWEKEKLFVTRNLSFSDSVFYPFG